MMLLHATPRRKDKVKQKCRELECDDECVRAKEKKIVLFNFYLFMYSNYFLKPKRFPFSYKTGKWERR
jgi:hypothetical protein